MTRMRDYLTSLQWRIRRLPGRLHDALFALACRLLLPLSTMCKVCNMLRGMALGFVLSVALCAATALLIGGA